MHPLNVITIAGVNVIILIINLFMIILNSLFKVLCVDAALCGA